MHKDTSLYLGVDVGGTKTHALIADQVGNIKGVGRAGPGNWEEVGLEGTFHAVNQAVNEALTCAGLSVTRMSAACYGMAGIDWPSDEARLAPVVERLRVPGPRILVNDAYSALRAGSRAGCGVAVIAGTGTTVAGCNRNGEHFRTFGYSAKWGDFGCAVHVVWLATRAVAHAYFGRGQPTALTERILDHYGAQDVPELVEKLARDQAEQPDGKLAPLVLEVAAEEDTVAQEIVQCVGRELGKNAVAVAGRLGLLDEAFDLVMAGGVILSGIEFLLRAILEPVQARASLVQPVCLQIAPVIGSVLLAMEAAGDLVTTDVWQRLSNEALGEPQLATQHSVGPAGPVESSRSAHN